MNEIQVVFNNPAMTALWNNEIVGQLSDGYYENWNAGNKSWWIRAVTGNENGFIGCTREQARWKVGYCNYNLKKLVRELYEIGIDERMVGFINIAQLACGKENEDDICFAAGMIAQFVIDNYDEECNNYEQCVRDVIEHEINHPSKQNEWCQKYYNTVKSVFPAGTCWETIVKTIVEERDINPRVRRRKLNKIVDQICGFVKQTSFE